MAAFEPGELGRALAPAEVPAHVAALLPPAACPGPALPVRPPTIIKAASPTGAKARPEALPFWLSCPSPANVDQTLYGMGSVLGISD